MKNLTKCSIAVIAENEEAAQYYCSLAVKGEPAGRADSGNAAEWACASNAEIAIIDCGFNNAWGMRMLREMKQKAPDIPVVYLTGLSSEDVAISAFRSGAREYIRKPADDWELRTVLQGLLKTKRSSWEKRSAFVRTGAKEPGAGMRTADGNEPYSVVRAVDYVEANLTSDIDLDGLAKAARVSKYHFCRVFKKCIGMSPLQYVTTARVEKAKVILQRADTPVAVVANMSGFRDISTFIRQFKRQTGMTPSAFRRSRPGELLQQ